MDYGQSYIILSHIIAISHCMSPFISAYTTLLLQSYLCILLTKQVMMGLCLFHIGWRFEVKKRIFNKSPSTVQASPDKGSLDV